MQWRGGVNLKGSCLVPIGYRYFKQRADQRSARKVRKRSRRHKVEEEEEEERDENRELYLKDIDTELDFAGYVLVLRAHVCSP